MGLNLGTGLGGGLNLAWPGTSGTNAGIATGPRTAAAQGFGTSASATGRQVSSLALGVLTVGTLALGGLLFIWWSLPR